MARENVTAYRITAEDATAQAWASVQRNAQDSIGRITSLLPGLAAALSGAGLVAFAKQGIDAADHLNDLSKSTGITVESLAGLKLLARQTGTDLDGLAKGINKMSVELGKDPEKFKALGITAKTNTEAFKQFADLFNTLPDINQRNALAQSVFGKSWAEIAPALSEGGQRIGEIIEKGTRLSGITQELAEQADKFNDKWAELTGTGALFNRVIGPALPLLNDLADSMLTAGENASGFNQAFSPVAETLRAIMILGANVSFVFDTMGKDIARAVENVKLIAKGDFAGSRALGELFRKDAAEARKALDDYEKRIMGMGLTGKAAPKPPPVDQAEADAASARAQAFLDRANAARPNPDEAQKFIDKQNELANNLAAGYERTKALLGQITEEAKVRYDTEFGKLAVVDDAIKANLITRARELDAANAAAAADVARAAATMKGYEEAQAIENAAAASMERNLQEREKDDADKIRRRQDDLIAVLDSLRTQRSIEDQDYVEKQQILQSRYETDFANRVFWQQKIWQLDKQHQQNLIAIEDAAIKKRYGINNVYRKLDLDSALFFANAMGGLMQTKSRELFEVGKVGAIAGAIIDSYKAATGSYAALASIPYVGPFLGAAAAAAALAIGIARVSAIKSTTFGSSGGGAIGTFAASPSTGLPETPTPAFETPAAPAQQQALASQRKDIYLTILGEGMFSAAQIRDSLIPLLNEAVGDGVTLRASVV